MDLRSPVDGAHVKQGAEVVVDFSCGDEGGSGLASCVGTVADGELLDTSQLGEVSVTVTARDHAGNETVVTNTVTVVDERKPTISVTTPAEGAVYELGSRVLADYSCADEPNGSGLDSCEGSVADGAAVDTASLGQKTFTVNASDEAGNTNSKSVTYTVVDTKAPEHHDHDPGRRRGLRGGRAGGRRLLLLGWRLRRGQLRRQRGRRRGRRHGHRSGEKTFTVQASDKAGNPASKTVSYTRRRTGRAEPSRSRARPRARCTRSASRCSRLQLRRRGRTAPGVATCEGSVAGGRRARHLAAWVRRRSRCSTSDNAGQRTVANRHLQRRL